MLRHMKKRKNGNPLIMFCCEFCECASQKHNDHKNTLTQYIKDFIITESCAHLCLDREIV